MNPNMMFLDYISRVFIGYTIAMQVFLQNFYNSSNFYCLWAQEALKKIYNWQYANCIDLWVKFISANIRDHDLQPLLYFIIQVISGVAHLFPGPRYFPLRLKCIQMLNQLSLSSGFFIPVSSLVLDSLEYRGSGKADARSGKAFNFSSVLKVRK